MESLTSRRAFLRAGLAAGGLCAGGVALPALLRSLVESAPVDPQDADWLRAFRDNVVHGGPPPDGIPPIDRPVYESAEAAARWLHEDDVVFGLDHGGEVRAYPQLILVWHEIVNESIAGEALSVTYCPLTGSAIGFKGRVAGVEVPLDFGTSGRLVNSNLLMYDRPTGSLWPQILGIAIDGPARSTVLQEFPLVWTTWGRWRRLHPETAVLSRNTGFARAYGQDPYGSYRRPGTYYDSGHPFFPVMARDPRFPPKEVVVGVKVGNDRLAILKESVRQSLAANLSAGGAPLVGLYDERLDAVRVYRRDPGGQVLTFTWTGDGFTDEATGSAWTGTGRAVQGPLAGTRLVQVDAWDVMWFAWYAFHPDTEVYAG